MRLYHYLETKWGLDDIRRRRLKISALDDMNDPYEWRAAYSSDERSQAGMEAARREWQQRYGLVCLSRSPNNILMWSHYADRHRGMCLGFDVPDGLAMPVDYGSQVHDSGSLTWGPTHGAFRDDEGEKVIDRNLRAKYDGWRYEEEVRLFAGRDEVDEETGLYFALFGEADGIESGDRLLTLREVIAGVRFPFTRKVIEDALKGYTEEVHITKARMSLDSYEIIADGPDGFSA